MNTNQYQDCQDVIHTACFKGLWRYVFRGGVRRLTGIIWWLCYFSLSQHKRFEASTDYSKRDLVREVFPTIRAVVQYSRKSMLCEFCKPRLETIYLGHAVEKVFLQLRYKTALNCNWILQNSQECWMSECQYISKNGSSLPSHTGPNTKGKNKWIGS